MAKKMLIDATHPEETRIVVVDGNKVEEFDFETLNKRQLAGNIYLAKVTRVEPSLQAAFVDYGGNRHGFLAFAEIHPDYYQIPIEDRQALLAEERALAREDDEEEQPRRHSSHNNRRRNGNSNGPRAERVAADAIVKTAELSEVTQIAIRPSGAMDVIDLDAEGAEAGPLLLGAAQAEPDAAMPVEPAAELAVEDAADVAVTAEPEPVALVAEEVEAEADIAAETVSDEELDAEGDAASEIETIAEADVSEEIAQPRRQRARRYKIQEVIKVRQIMLVQVVKEERGNKGAALTTYLSLAGRYCVLMPNTARGGGISRKITQVADRKKLKEIASELEVPEGAGLIIRTAGARRTKPEIRRDYEYLMRLWEQIRELTLRSIAPVAIYEEGDLIKRSIRDLYTSEIDEVFVEGAEGFCSARDFMRMIMPSQARQVKLYNEQMPLFARYQVESYLGGMLNPVVQLKSGGYLVIGVTEALVAIDVNSGRATKEGSIEETALKTNLEAADEVARQLRLRDLAGLIVIDFIDMDERKNNAAVEKRLKDRLKTDRARIQIGRISGFGLMEMSRQRLRPGVLESTTQPCQHCHGTGLIRSDDSMALTILRALEEEGTRKRSKEVLLKAPVGIVNYLFNHKREHIALIESRYGMAVRMEADPSLVSPDYSLDKFKTATRALPEPSQVISGHAGLMGELIEDEIEVEIDEAEVVVEAATEAEAEAEVSPNAATDEQGDGQKKKRRRRRRRRGGARDGQAADAGADDAGEEGDQDADEEAVSVSDADVPELDVTVVEASQEAPVLAASDEVAPVKKTASRSRSRSKAKAPLAVEPSAEVTPAAVAEVVVVETDAAPSDEAVEGAVIAEVAPKKPAARKRAPAKTKVAAQAAPVIAAVLDAVVEAAAEGEAASAKPKSSRSRTKTAAKPAASRGARAKKAETAEVVEAPVAPAEPVAPAVHEVSVQAAPAVTEVAVPQSTPVATPEPEAPKGPRRKGWWSK